MHFAFAGIVRDIAGHSIFFGRVAWILDPGHSTVTYSSHSFIDPSFTAIFHKALVLWKGW
jgi:hypothetical protein